MPVTRMLKAIVPPLLWSAGKDLKRRLVPSVDHYEFARRGWQTPLPPGGGNEAYWNTFLAREKRAYQELIVRLRGTPALLTGDDEVVKYVTFGYALALASRHKDRLSVLDYGGNLGEYYWIGKALVPGIELDFHCKELPAVAAVGRELTPEVSWHTDDACLGAAYDLVMFSASLPYLPQWQDILHRAAQGTREYLLLSDIPSVRTVPSFVITQRTGGVTHLQNLLNRSEIVDTVLHAGLRLVREFAMGSHPPVANAPEQPLSAGWLFQR